MPDLPWELLATRVGRYLQGVYVTATLSGATLIGELMVRAVDGPSSNRRQAVLDAISAVTSAGKSVFVVVLVAAMVVLISYAVGTGLRYLIWAALYTIQAIVQAMTIATRLGSPKRRLQEWIRHQAGDTELRRARRSVTIHGERIDVERPVGVLVFVWTLLRNRTPTGKQTWESLTYSYGEDQVRDALAGHPIRTPITDDWQVEAVGEYCLLWLKRYAPDMAITPSTTRFLVGTTIFVPAVLLPGTLRSVYADIPNVMEWVDRLTPGLMVLLVYLLLTSFRNQGASAQTFRRFVLVQLIQGSRSPAATPTDISVVSPVIPPPPPS